MNKKEYQQAISNCHIVKEKVEKAEKEYKQQFPDYIQRIISFCDDEPIFLDNSARILSYPEIIKAKKELHVDFPNQGIIPIADYNDNDFIVYHFADKNWSLFNIVDEISFKIKEDIMLLL